MRRVRVQFSPMGQRWAVDLVGVEGRPVTVFEQGDVTVSRDERGRVTSIVIDAVRVESDVIETIVEEFGSEIADLMAEPRDDEFDEVFIVDDRPGTAVIRGDSPRAGTPMVVLPDEPGVPVPIDGERFRVVVQVDARQVQGIVDHDRASARMRIEIEFAQDGEPQWVRVAEGESGAILALAPLQSSSEHSSTVDLSFGLAVPMQALHVSVSDEPLADPGDRSDRRRRWARDLETLATKRARRLRGDASTLFERAAGVHENLGDHDAAERCRVAARRTRHRRRWLGGFGVPFAVVALAGLGFTLGRTSSAEVEGVETGAASVPVLSDPPVPTLPSDPPNPGPIDVVFDERSAAQVFVTGDAALSPGEDLVFVVRTRVSSNVTFERLQDCVNSESGNSLVFGDGPMYQPTFIPVLVNVSDPTVGSRAFAPFAVDRSADTYFVLPGACSENWIQDGLSFTVAAIETYSAYTSTISLPNDLEPGLWELRLVLENVEGVSATGEYVTVLIG